MQQHRTPSRLFSYLTTERLLLGTVLTSSLILLIEFMLTAHDRRGTQRGQACTGKARHNNEVARLRHVAALGLGRGSRCGGRSTALVTGLLSIGVGLFRTCAGGSIGSTAGIGAGDLVRRPLTRRKAAVKARHQR